MVAMAVKVTYKYRVSHGNLMSFTANKLLPLPVRQDMDSSVTGLVDAILVANGQWTDAQSMFIISRGGAIPWPTRSPDLSVSDYFIWEYLKSKVYLMKPCDNDELKNTIKEEITATPDTMVREAMRTLRDSLEHCR
jgi:hypothetical protein